jgi:hypothetical protein
LARVLLSVGDGPGEVKVTEVTGGAVAGLGVAIAWVDVVMTTSVACLTTTRTASTTAGFRIAILPETMLRLGGDLNDSRAQSVHQAIVVENAGMGN